MNLKKLIPQKIINYGKHLPIAILANLKYGFPASGIVIVGVTGTDGKTTTVNMIHRILTDAGYKSSMVSTIQAVIGGKNIDTGLHVTSPNPLLLQKYIKMAKESGSKVLVLEVTSHALDQFRFWGIKFDIGIVTNITHEHLDYHGSWEKYFQAKSKLVKNAKKAILNFDEKHFHRLSKIATGQIISFGMSVKAQYNPVKYRFKLKIPGQYNILNGLAALAAVSCLGVDVKNAISSLERFTGLAGRMEEFRNDRGYKIFIDFAHTPNGLEQALKTLKGLARGRVLSIIGAEGERDIQKRPMLGEIAQKFSDFVILTAVDPRGQLNRINRQILVGSKKAGGVLGKNLFVIDDRQQAIDFAISIARRGDVVGIFGKGHEKSLNLDGRREIPWSDHQAVKRALVHGK